MSQPTGPVLSCKEHWPISYETKKKLRFGARILAVQIIYPDLACRKRYGRNLRAARYANMHRKGVAELPSGHWPYSKLMGQKEKPPL
tara:strand:- start:458 stop:718 length:261 start_codon:yes stop_codon:yes gene_type:complete